MNSVNFDNPASAVYYTSSPHIIDHFDSNLSNEIGLHCGTEDQAIERNPHGYLHEVTINPSVKTAVCTSDCEESWNNMSVVNVLDISGLLNGAEKVQLIQACRQIIANEDNKYTAMSKLFRNFLLDKGYKLVRYPNGVERFGESIFILSADAVVNLTFLRKL